MFRQVSNTQQSEICERFKSMVNNPRLSNIKFRCSDSVTVYAHKFVLSCQLPEEVWKVGIANSAKVHACILLFICLIYLEEFGKRR